MVGGAAATKFIVVTGGVLSGLGKGVAAASIGNLVAAGGNKVIAIKCDGYLNVDPGTMNPVEHGEVFVLDDGGEVDMDFGHYERFLGITCSRDWNLTMGKVFETIRTKERRGDFLGKTVQLIPHVSDEIRNHFHHVATTEQADVVLIEVGGTVGDLENELYIEACRALGKEVGEENILYVHLTYVPIPAGVSEQKSKPTQQSVAQLRERGIEPHIIIGRCSEYLTPAIREKISTFCGVAKEAVITGLDVSYVYELPLIFAKEGMIDLLQDELGVHAKLRPNWIELVQSLQSPKQEVTIALCGKYTALEDSYASIVEALHHCRANLHTNITLSFIDTTDITSCADAQNLLKGVDGVIVPGGFGARGVEGKIHVVRCCRENNIPFLGICYGLQLAVIEFARNVCGLKNASSTEFNEQTPDPVVDILPEQKQIVNKGGTMRLGAYAADLQKGSLVRQLYGGKPKASERHRHRYEVNPAYHEILQKNGLVFSGLSPDGTLVEFIELPNHPYFVGTQAHPELKSKLEEPAPLFYGLIKACLETSSS
ncbi:MAG: CTP synthase (glutamine hydrolyzing) [Candidatus Woesearchaeota archaeon]|nr:MAG: CTP synthase (glutamine hydrolyzing) [Candidatus Woesearchaeota archaeon]